MPDPTTPIQRIMDFVVILASLIGSLQPVMPQHGNGHFIGDRDGITSSVIIRIVIPQIYSCHAIASISIANLSGVTEMKLVENGS